MKYTKKQKEEIIKNAIKILKRDNSGMCWAITKSLDLCNLLSINNIQSIFPKFKRTTAIKYFKASKVERGTLLEQWWYPQAWHGSIEDKNNRVRFLRYLIRGKLPKKRSKK